MFTILFSDMLDLDSDGTHEFLALIQTTPDSKQDREKLYLVSTDGKNNIKTKIHLNFQNGKTKQWVSKIKTGYFVGNGKPQIMTTLYQIPLDKKSKSSTHKETTILLQTNEGRFDSIFSSSTYSIKIKNHNNELVRMCSLQFKPSQKNAFNALHQTCSIQKHIFFRKTKATSSNQKKIETKSSKATSLVFEFSPLQQRYMHNKHEPLFSTKNNTLLPIISPSEFANLPPLRKNLAKQHKPKLSKTKKKTSIPVKAPQEDKKFKKMRK